MCAGQDLLRRVLVLHGLLELCSRVPCFQVTLLRLAYEFCLLILHAVYAPLRYESEVAAKADENKMKALRSFKLREVRWVQRLHWLFMLQVAPA